jgi:hypothetical protein
VVFLADPYSIRMWDLDVQASRVVGTPRVVVMGTVNGQARSPTPIYGPDGNVKALWHSYTGSSILRADLYFASDLDPLTPSLLAAKTFRIDTGGGVGAGRVYMADNNPVGIYDAVAAWMTGDEVAIGGRARLSIASPLRGSTLPLSLVLAARQVAAPIQIPGVFGSFALDPTLLLVLGIAPNFPKTGLAELPVPIPNSQILRGASLALQSLVIAPNNEFYLTNTATLTVR